MNDRRSKKLHQYIRTNGNQAWNFDFYKRKERFLHSSRDRQQNCSILPIENWRYPQQTIARHQQVNLAIPLWKTNRNYCRISPQQSELKSRLGISTCSRQVRVEPPRINTSENSFVYLHMGRPPSGNFWACGAWGRKHLSCPCLKIFIKQINLEVAFHQNSNPSIFLFKADWLISICRFFRWKQFFLHRNGSLLETVIYII